MGLGLAVVETVVEEERRVGCRLHLVRVRIRVRVRVRVRV